MQQHKMSRMAQIIDFECFIVSGYIASPNFNGEDRFQLSLKLKKLEQKVMFKFVLCSTVSKT